MIMWKALNAHVFGSLYKGRKHDLESRRHVLDIPVFEFVHIFIDVRHS